MAILLDKRSIVEVLVKNGAEAADCTCKKCLLSLVNHFLDISIGRDMQVKAVDIAFKMGRREIYDILTENGLTGVRYGRTTTCDLADEYPSPFTFQLVSDLGFVVCDLC